VSGPSLGDAAAAASALCHHHRAPSSRQSLAHSLIAPAAETAPPPLPLLPHHHHHRAAAADSRKRPLDETKHHHLALTHSLTHTTAAALSCHEHKPHSLARGRTDRYRTNCSIDNTGVARGCVGASRTGRHLLGSANGRKLFIKIHVKIQIV